ncbi:MAG: PD40 domain-containing protein [Gemmatimonadaceae bacterium]|nr:PD40 domain-containing protein [Gemmatimonadaceae bacterium]
MRRRIPRLTAAVAIAALVACLSPARGAAQAYFGQNQVQFKQITWRVIRTDHFDVHYYQEEEEAAKTVARMAERSYARLSRLLGYEFRERKPIVFFASRGDFAQNNVTGDLGEGTGGVTDALRQRNMFFAGQDMGETEHVLTHEMVHQFQYDIQFRGRTGAAMMASDMSSEPLPLWYAEGMAEYLSIGPHHPATDAVMRDAALNGNLPTIQQMTQSPDRWFPYRYGEAFWRFIGKRWGDEIIGEILQSTATSGVSRSFKRFTGYELDDLGDEWKETMQTDYLPGIAALERPRKVAQPLLNERRTGGIIPVYVAPALSSDGRQIAYISTGSLLRAEVFLDLYLADATTGKRIKRLTNSTLNPETEELRYAYSQSAFTPDGRTLAYTAQREGKDVLYLLDVRSRRIVRRLDTGLDQMIGPSWSPDGRRIVFSGSKSGFSNLYMIDADGRNLRALTNDFFGAVMPSWSPDGRRIAFVSDRGQKTDISLLRFSRWEINIFDLETNKVETIPAQGGKNLNPQWAPDGKSLAYISDRTGIAQLFLYDFDAHEHYQLTKFIGGISSVTENSPAMTWARQADKLAFVYMDNGEYTIWSLSNPRQYRGDPYREPAPVVALGAAPAASGTAAARPAAAPGDSAASAQAEAAQAVRALAQKAVDAARDSTSGRRLSLYRTGDSLRPSALLPPPGAPGSQPATSVAALLDSAALALPSESSLKEEPYKPTLRPEYISRPSIGYAQENYGRGVYGGTTLIFGDLLGNRQLAVSASLNGRLEEAQGFFAFQNSARRVTWAVGALQTPYFFLSNYAQTGFDQNGVASQYQTLERFVIRQGFLQGAYPLNRFNRIELGSQFTSIDRASMFLSQQFSVYGYGSGVYVDSIRGSGTLNYLSPYTAYVSDNALQGLTGPIYGHRYRLELRPNLAGDSSWVNYLVDARRYDAILFNFLTLATRFNADLAVGRGELRYPKYIGYPYYIRGYDRENYNSADCGTNGSDGKSSSASTCSLVQLLGSRVVIANAELRFPLIRRFDLGILPISLPPIDGAFFYDAGMAWSSGQQPSLTQPDNYDFTRQRFMLRSYGYGIRMNLFNIAVLRWDYAVPRDGFYRQGHWQFSIGPSY